jgi:hypothetical protein
LGPEPGGDSAARQAEPEVTGPGLGLGRAAVPVNASYATATPGPSSSGPAQVDPPGCAGSTAGPRLLAARSRRGPPGPPPSSWVQQSESESGPGGQPARIGLLRPRRRAAPGPGPFLDRRDGTGPRADRCGAEGPAAAGGPGHTGSRRRARGWGSTSECRGFKRPVRGPGHRDTVKTGGPAGPGSGTPGSPTLAVARPVTAWARGRLPLGPVGPPASRCRCAPGREAAAPVPPGTPVRGGPGRAS